MDLKPFVRKPFMVEAVEVTKDNIEEIAPLVGELKTKGDGTRYILVDKNKVRNIFRVYPGFWLTKMNDNIRCYAGNVFKEQFYASNDKVETLVSELTALNSQESG